MVGTRPCHIGARPQPPTLTALGQEVPQPLPKKTSHLSAYVDDEFRPLSKPSTTAMFAMTRWSSSYERSLLSWTLSLHCGRQQLHSLPAPLRLGCYQHSHLYRTHARPYYVLRVTLPPTFTAPLPVAIRTASSCDMYGCCGMFQSCAIAIMRHADKRLPML